MMQKKHGKKSMAKHAKLNEGVSEATRAYDNAMISGENSVIYNFGVGVVEGDTLTLSKDSIKIPGQDREVTLDIPNPYEDMS
jgi:hypothetical protein